MLKKNQFFVDAPRDYIPRSLELHQTGEWFNEGTEIEDPDLINSIKEHIKFLQEEKKLVMEMGEAFIPIEIKSPCPLVIDLEISGPGKYERVEMMTTRGRITLDTDTLRMDHDSKTMYCLLNGEEEAKFLRMPMIKILDRLMEGNNGKFYLNICGKILPI